MKCVIARLHANAGPADQKHHPVGREEKSNPVSVEGRLLDLPGRGGFRTRAAWLFLMVFITWFALLWCKCFSGIFGDLILESLSTKECNKITAPWKWRQPLSRLPGLSVHTLCRQGGLKRVSDSPKVSLESARIRSQAHCSWPGLILQPSAD